MKRSLLYSPSLLTAVLLALLISPPLLLLASDTDISFDSANTSFSKKRYEQAITEYRQLIAENGLSAEYMHNLANSYAANDQYGLAILHYLRGLRLAPGDHDLQGDLALARKNAGIILDSHNKLETFLSFLDRNQWAVSGLVCYAAMALLLLLSVRYRILPWLKWCLAVLVTFCLFSAFAVYSSTERWSAGVIVAPDTRLLISPFEDAASRGELAEGTVIFPKKEYRGFTSVETRNGRFGWIPSATFEKINTHYLTYSR